jgi:hypothetical protein
MLPPLLVGMPSRHKIALEIGLCLSTRGGRLSSHNTASTEVVRSQLAVAGRRDLLWRSGKIIPFQVC